MTNINIYCDQHSIRSSSFCHSRRQSDTWRPTSELLVRSGLLGAQTSRGPSVHGTTTFRQCVPASAPWGRGLAQSPTNSWPAGNRQCATDAGENRPRTHSHQRKRRRLGLQSVRVSAVRQLANTRQSQLTDVLRTQTERWIFDESVRLLRCRHFATLARPDLHGRSVRPVRCPHQLRQRLGRLVQ